MPPTDLWQHRLYFRGGLQSDYGEIRVCVVRPLTFDLDTQTPQIPFKDFTYTRRGEHFEENIDEFYRDRVSMVGISVLGGNAGLEGPYELGIDEIWATNEELAPAKVCSPALTAFFSHVSDPPDRPVRGVIGLQYGLDSQFGRAL